MNKRGNFPDVAEYFKVAFILVFTIVILMLFLDSWNSGIIAMDDATIHPDIKTGSTELNTALYKNLDFFFIFIFLIFVVFSAVMARIIPSSPIFIIVSIVSIVLLPLVALMLENVFDAFVNQASIIPIMANMPILAFFLDKFVYFILFYCFAIGLSLLTKKGDVVR